MARGDLSKKVTADVKGEILTLKNTINDMVDRLGTFAFEVSKVAREVGTDGTLGGQAQVEHVEGKWKDLTDNVNTMAQVCSPGRVRERMLTLATESHESSAQHIRCHPGYRARGYDAHDSCSRAGRNTSAEEHHQ